MNSLKNISYSSLANSDEIEDNDNNFDDFFTFKFPKGLKIVCINIRSLMKHKNQIEVILTQRKIDIFCCVETWLTAVITDFELQINGYRFFRLDRSCRRGGGVIIYTRINEKIEYELVNDFQKTIEMIMISVKQYKAKPFIIGCVYRPPNPSADLDKEFIGFIENYTEGEVILIGDFNEDNNSSNFTKLMSNLGLSQEITEPTRIANDSSTLIDHVYCNIKANKSGSGVLPLEIADHKGIFFCRILNFLSKSKTNWK